MGQICLDFVSQAAHSSAFTIETETDEKLLKLSSWPRGNPLMNWCRQVSHNLIHSNV